MIRKFGKAKIELEKNLAQVCKNANLLMQKDLERVLLSGGKRLRPALVFTAYNLKENPVLPVQPLMLMVELMHSASLIHDDVVDHGLVRRDVPTINATSGDNAAIKSADYILAKAMELLKIYKGTGINERLAKVSEQMCIGEFDQIDCLHKDIDTVSYFNNIKKKTAFFISSCASCGALAAGLSEEEVQMLSDYGLNVGIAFQIKDDILDFTGSKGFGKPLRQDESRGIKTLPMIIGLENAQNEVELFSNKAIDAIKNINDCKAKKALIEMAQNLVDRKI